VSNVAKEEDRQTSFVNKFVYVIKCALLSHFGTTLDIMSAKQSLGNRIFENELLAGHRGLRPHHQMYQKMVHSRLPQGS